MEFELIQRVSFIIFLGNYEDIVLLVVLYATCVRQYIIGKVYLKSISCADSKAVSS